MTKRGETMTLEKVVKMLEVEYERAKKMDFVKNRSPMLYIKYGKLLNTKIQGE